MQLATKELACIVYAPVITGKSGSYGKHNNIITQVGAKESA